MIAAAAVGALGIGLHLSHDEASRAASAASVAPRSGCAQLAERAAAARRGEHPPAGTPGLSLLVQTHLASMRNITTLVELTEGGALLPAFAANVVPPPVLIPWLALVSAAACAVAVPGGVVPTGTLQYLMMQYLTTVHDLLCHKVFSQHAHALTSSPEQQHVIAAALLRWALPALATAVEAAGRTAGSGAAEWLSLSHCGPPGPARADTPEPPSVLSLLCECLEPTAAAVSGMLLGPDGSALVQQAGRLLRALLLDPPPGLAPAALLSSQADAANIATFLCFRMIDQMEGAGSGQGSSSRATAIAREQRQAAAWELLCLLPHLLVVLQDQAAQHQHGQAALTCHRLELAVQLVYGEKDILRVGSFQEAADLLASSEAAARLAPVLVRLASDRQPQAPPSVSRAPAVVLSSLIRLVWHNSGAYILQSMGG